jgi:glycine/D-amino acid oxidase-like deaminating enzyme
MRRTRSAVRGPALWWDVLPPDEPLVSSAPLATDESARTCVVGGGIAGASLALALARRGDDVVLLDREFPGWGATGRNAGFLLAESDCFAMAAAHVGEDAASLLREAGLATRAFVRSLAAPVEWTGSVRLASDDGEAAWFRDSARHGLDGVAEVDVESVPERGTGDAYRAALLDAGDGMTNPLRLLRAIHAESARRGVRRFDGTAALSLDDSRRGAVVRTARAAVRADRVVVATNSEARFLLGADVAPIRPVRAQALAAFVEPMPRWTRPVYATRGGDYWRPVGADRVLLGGLRRLDRPAEATRSTDATPDLQRALTRMLRRLVGRGARVEVTHRWAGTMGFTKDGLPRAGAVPARPRVHVFAGWNGHGMGWAPGFADAYAAHLAGDGPPPARAFRPMYFGRRGTRP